MCKLIVSNLTPVDGYYEGKDRNLGAYLVNMARGTDR